MKKVYEVVFVGFDGSTDKTDNLIVWIEADNMFIVEDFVSDMPVETVNRTGYTEKDKCADMSL